MNAAANQAPIANAGPDINLTLPSNATNVAGSGTDADGTIVSFQWLKISGPVGGNINNPSAALTNINGLAVGLYSFKLTVTDNEGLSSSDTMQISVNPAITSNCNNNAPVTYYLNYTSAPGEIYRPNGSAWKGGDTVKIVGTNYSVIEFYNIKGDACRPIVIMPQTTLTTPVLRVTGNSKYLKIWGGKTQYGIKIANGALAINRSSFIEAKNMEIFGGSIGVYCKQDPYYDQPDTWGNSSNAMSNIQLRNLYIHDVNGEGMYLGHTSPNGLSVRKPDGSDTLIIPIKLDSIEVSDCIVERTQWDGIQLSHARAGNKIFNNIVRDYGMLNLSSQQAGIIMGGNTTGDIFNNNVFKGTGNGIEAFGYGVINIYNNVMDSCGYDGTPLGQQTIYASDYLTTSEVNPKQTMNIYGNAINHPTLKAGIFITGYFSNSFPSSVYNNTFCLTNPPANWQSVYMKLYVPGTTITNNTLSCATVPPPPNQAPTANAGADKTITLPANSVSLVGIGSDADGTIVNYQWLKISGPAAGIITTANAANTTVTGLVQGVYLLKFTVTDNFGAQGSDTMKITVNSAPNQAPTANAGLDQNITLPLSTVNLSGSGTDPDGTIINYKWTKISGPAAGTITNSNIAVTTATGLIQGVYIFRLTVTDNAGATAFDDMQVMVNAAPNQAPTANAGLNQNITLPVNTASLSGSGTDPDGTIVTFKWTKVSGPAAGTITNSNIASTTATGLVQGVYTFRLTVTDNAGATAFDDMTVTVNSASNQTPAANAGIDQTITLPLNVVSLIGSGSDSDGSIISYNWVKVSGPAAGTLSNANTAATTVTGLVQGIYIFRLTVTDNGGATASDDVQITVNAAPNQAPTANAGLDQNITLPLNTANLTGSGSDPDGNIISYQWSKVSGPAAGTITNSNAIATMATGLVQGVYIFKLTVTDNGGATGFDEMKVTVNAAPNQAPTANAGLDQNLNLPVNIANLIGAGSDADGTITAYSWTKISGPVAGTITNTGIAVTTATGLVQGVYTFRLTVTDNAGATGYDDMKVTVNASNNQAPTANAGPDQNITLPLNTANLNGSGNDPDGSIVSYVWTKVSGPAAGVISNTNLALTSVTALVEGIYTFRLTVKDNSGATASDDVVINVHPASVPVNQKPIANAGGDINIYLPQNRVTVNGSGSDPDGTIVSYEWKIFSGNSGYAVSDIYAAQSEISNLQQGVYLLELTVTDNAGETGKDTMRITVGANRSSNTELKVNVFPNPVRDILHITIDKGNVVSDKAKMQIITINGAEIWHKNISIIQNGQTEEVVVSHLAAGNYILRIILDDGKVLSKKIIKL